VPACHTRYLYVPQTVLPAFTFDLTFTMTSFKSWAGSLRRAANLRRLTGTDALAGQNRKRRARPLLAKALLSSFNRLPAAEEAR